MKIGIIVQARMSSQRLPDKVLTKVNGKPLLQYLLERLNNCSSIDQVIEHYMKGGESYFNKNPLIKPFIISKVMGIVPLR